MSQQQNAQNNNAAAAVAKQPARAASAAAKQDLWNLRHTAQHVLQQALKELYPQVQLAMGPATDDGFYCDFDPSPKGAEPVKITDQDFCQLEERMAKLIAADLPLVRQEISLEAARTQFANNPYKLEWIDAIAQKDAQATVYWTGTPDAQASMVDLCAGPHASSTGAIKAFKLLSVAGAYWHGDEKNKMLTRIYGTAFFSQEELDEYLRLQEEAKARDHRKLGAELELFFIDEMVGKGLISWLPKGNILKEQIEQFAKQKEDAAGYKRVTTPHIAKKELFETSGHLPYYADSMYPPMKMDDGEYYLKAMNCPHHHRMYAHTPKSYRELPLRLAEYGTCYRNELSGAVAGLLRVRGMAMNDAHIYCRRDQIKDEFMAVIKLTQEYFVTFGLSDYWFRLSKWDPQHTDKYVDQPENWQYSEQVLREVLEELQVPFFEADDEAAFYGPKVDVQFTSVVGREETMSTIQLDFMAKERFGLSYTDESGQENNDVFVIHRAPLSTHERFLAFLIEHYAGRFPTWLSPVQVKVLPVSDKFAEYAAGVADQLHRAGVRVELDDRAERLGAKIRQAELEKVPYMLIIGGKEEQDATVTVRSRDDRGGSDASGAGDNNQGSDANKQETLSVAAFVAQVVREIDERG